MPPAKPTNEMTLRELRAEIKRLTDREPRHGAGERYLRRRLDDLRARKKEGEDVRHKAESAVCSFSTTESAKAALERVIGEERKKADGEGSMSKIARKGIAMWLKSNGYVSAAELMEAE